MSKNWGIPTWIFFHSLAAQLPDVLYSEMLLTQFKQLCSVLPCPECAMHATAYMSKIRFAHVPTREAFRLMLWTFHNFVNLRKRTPQFPLEKMSIYDRVNLQRVYGVFIREFSKPLHIPKLFVDSMARTRITQQFKSWMATVCRLQPIMGNPTRLAPIPKPAPVRAVTPMLGM